MEKQRRQVGRVGEWKVAVDSTDEAPAPGHHNVTEIVHVPSILPPAVQQEFRPTLRLHVLSILDLVPRQSRKSAPHVSRLCGLVSEVVLLTVGRVKHPVANDMTCHNCHRDDRIMLEWTLLVQIQGLQRENKGDNDEVEKT